MNIAKGPEEISYRGHFDITVAGDPRKLTSVVMLRSDHNTHSVTTGDRYVKLSFSSEGRGAQRGTAGEGAEDAGAGDSGHLHALRARRSRCPERGEARLLGAGKSWVSFPCRTVIGGVNPGMGLLYRRIQIKR